MKAQNLRIGNYLDLYGATATIQAEDFKRYIDDKKHFERFKPIPLTEDRLVQLGASYRIINNGIHEYAIVCTPDNYKKEYRLVFRFGEQKDKLFNFYWYPFKDSGDMHVFPCEYIHQLQNLFFAISGKELIIK